MRGGEGWWWNSIIIIIIIINALHFPPKWITKKHGSRDLKPTRTEPPPQNPQVTRTGFFCVYPVPGNGTCTNSPIGGPCDAKNALLHARPNLEKLGDRMWPSFSFPLVGNWETGKSGTYLITWGFTPTDLPFSLLTFYLHRYWGPPCVPVYPRIPRGTPPHSMYPCTLGFNVATSCYPYHQPSLECRVSRKSPTVLCGPY